LRGYAARTGGAVAAGLAVFDYDRDRSATGGRASEGCTDEGACGNPGAGAERAEFFSTGAGAIDIPATSASTLDRVRQAIASRVFENAGASLEFVEEDDTAIGFILRIPRQTAVGRPY